MSTSYWSTRASSSSYAQQRGGYSAATYSKIFEEFTKATKAGNPSAEAVNQGSATAAVTATTTDSDGAAISVSKLGSRLLDIGCGSGQVLKSIAPAFDYALGSDLSETQIQAAREVDWEEVCKVDGEGGTRACQVKFVVGPGEGHPLPEGEEALWTGNTDLITCASALHWIDATKFGAHVSKLLAPGGCLIIWTPLKFTLEPEECTQALTNYNQFFKDRGVWPAERRHMDNEYAQQIPQIIEGSGDQLELVANPRVVDKRPNVPIRGIAQFQGTISANQKWKSIKRAEDPDPVALLEAELTSLAGGKATVENTLLETPIFVLRKKRPQE